MVECLYIAHVFGFEPMTYRIPEYAQATRSLKVFYMYLFFIYYILILFTFTIYGILIYFMHEFILEKIYSMHIYMKSNA